MRSELLDWMKSRLNDAPFDPCPSFQKWREIIAEIERTRLDRDEAREAARQIAEYPVKLADDPEETKLIWVKAVERWPWLEQ